MLYICENLLFLYVGADAKIRAQMASGLQRFESLDNLLLEIYKFRAQCRAHIVRVL